MRRTVLAIAIGLIVVSCGGGETGADSDAASDGGTTADLPDPCALVDQSILDGYFSEAVEPESGESGPLATCKWRDSNANSVLVQVASDFEVTRPDPCDGCIDLAFADDGYAWESPLQSGATFVVGSTYFSIATTGLGDDTEAMAALAESIYEASK